MAVENVQVLRVKMPEKIGGIINLGVHRGPKQGGFGISVPTKSFLERTPAVDNFIKKALKEGFELENFDMVASMLRNKKA